MIEAPLCLEAPTLQKNTLLTDKTVKQYKIGQKRKYPFEIELTKPSIVLRKKLNAGTNEPATNFVIPKFTPAQDVQIHSDDDQQKPNQSNLANRVDKTE